MSLQRNIRKAIEGGATIYATVEANTNGFVTVKLLGSSSRITNLEYVGSISPQVGDQVVLDYSAGDKPIVRISENQLYNGERYMLETIEPLEMQDALTDPNDDGASVPGGDDIGVALTTKPGSMEYPNEPHVVDTAWIQHWGKNTDNWKATIYDSGSFDKLDPVTGTQYFTVPVSGIYMVTLTTNADIGTQGILRARVMRSYGTDPDVPFMKAIASPSGYGDYFNINAEKIMYLPAGDVLSVELMFTGSASTYSLKDTTNPLKWITAQNEFIFKTQLLSISPVVTEEAPNFIPATYYWWGATKTFTIRAGGSGGSVPLPGIQGDGFYVYDLTGDGYQDFVSPYIGGISHSCVGMVCTMHYTYYAGDCMLIPGTNTNWCQKFNDYWTGGADEFYFGETIFWGSGGASAWSGMSIDPSTDWEPQNWKHGNNWYFPNIRVYHQLGAAGPYTSFTLTPVFYGWLSEDPGYDPPPG